jgi:hypothetical protein
MAKSKKKITLKENSKPKFPYTSQPAELKRLLQLIPTKPKPPKLVTSTAQSWGIKNNSVGVSLGVLKEIGLLDPSGVPTEDYAAYMVSGSGGLALGQKIKERYKQLFDTHLEPQNASNDELRNFFNINSGGAEGTIDYQVKTFKALSEFASFDGTYTPLSGQSNSAKKQTPGQSPAPQIHFDLHIHLPEGKNSSDYEAIIRSISDHIVSKMKAN